MPTSEFNIRLYPDKAYSDGIQIKRIQINPMPILIRRKAGGFSELLSEAKFAW